MPEITYYAALPFVLTDDGLVPGNPVSCPSAGTAILRAETLSRVHGNAGAVAFSRTDDPHCGVYDDAVVLKVFGEIPSDLSMLF
jgi:hypothetical protein